MTRGKILCTGGAGYIGSHTILALIESGYEVAILDNLCNSNKEVLNRIEQITGQKVDFFLVDLLDAVSLDKVFQENSFSSVIHFASLKAVGESVAKPLLYYHNNLFGIVNLMQTMTKHNVKSLVFSSSATVYQASEVPLTEQAPLGPSNPYGQTKAMIEQIIRDVCQSDSAFSCSLLRYFNPVGAHHSGLIGEDPKDIPNNLMPYVQQVAVGRLPFLNVFGNDYDTVDGTGVRDYIHVVDLAKAHVKALKYVFKNTGCHVHNLGTGRGYSVLEMVNAFEDACGKEIKYKIGGRRPGDLSTVVCDPSKAEAELEWKAERGLVDICRDAWKWQSGNPNGFEEKSE